MINTIQILAAFIGTMRRIGFTSRPNANIYSRVYDATDYYRRNR